MEYLPIGTNLSILQDLWDIYISLASHGVQLLEKFKFVPQPTNVWLEWLVQTCKGPNQTIGRWN
jgi:hypothetical protein